MTRRVLVQIVAAVVVAVFAVGILLGGDTRPATWLRFYSVAVSCSLGILWLWEHVLWRLPLFQAIPGVPRNIRGTWKGRVVSLWSDPGTGASPGGLRAFLIIRQSASSVSLVLLTEESRSKSSIASLVETDGMVTLTYVYLNSPSILVEGRSRMHHGSAALNIGGSPASMLNGRYWTDRDSRGEMEFNIRSTRICDDFQAAKRLLGA